MGVESVINSDLNTLRAPSVHFTIIFNAFVLMNLFNKLNVRSIDNRRNIFVGIHKNLAFFVIWICCLIGQVIKIKEITFLFVSEMNLCV